MYTLILVLFLGVQPNIFPVQTEITFQTREECEKAKSTANFSTEIPVIAASATCEKRNET